MSHDPLCRLLKQEPCHGIGGADFGHYLDQPTCRNCGARCDCERIAEIRAAIAQDIEAMELGQIGMMVSLFDAARDRAARIARRTT